MKTKKQVEVMRDDGNQGISRVPLGVRRAQALNVHYVWWTRAWDDGRKGFATGLAIVSPMLQGSMRVKVWEIDSMSDLGPLAFPIDSCRSTGMTGMARSPG